MQDDNAPRAGLSSEDSEDLCARVLGFARADHTRVTVSSNRRGFTRTAINRITSAGSADSTSVTIMSVFGRRQASISTNGLDDASLERAVRQAEALARISPENPEYLPELGEQEYLDIDAYYVSTGGLTTETRARAASLAIDAARDADMIAAGFIDVTAGSRAIATSNGLYAIHSSTGVASTLTVRRPDGQSSGWAGDEGADWNTIESDRIADDAVRKCRDWNGKTALDPGRYDVVLEPTAVGNLVLRMMSAFGARAADEGRSFFSRQGGGNMLGEPLFDERLTIRSDPAEANAETAAFDASGLPVRPEVWVENGIVKSLSYSRFWAERNDTEPKPPASNIIMSGGDASLEDLIGATERGVLITRLWYIRQLNPQTVAYTGLTRDGTFLIEDGAISRPVTNFRFNQSIAEMLANIDLLGRPRRVFGNEGGYGPPVIVPPLKVRDFNLSSVSDAI